MGTVARVQITFNCATDVPRDYITNTLYYSRGDAGSLVSGDYSALASQVGAIFQNTDSLHTWTESLHLYQTVNVYDMGDPTPRPERAHSTYTPAAPFDRTHYDYAGKAVVLSFNTGRNIVGERSHIFLGPLSTTYTGPHVPDALVAEAAALGGALKVLPGGYKMLVYHGKTSKHHAAGDASPVTAGFVANEWGVIHKRGQRATSRTTF